MSLYAAYYFEFNYFTYRFFDRQNVDCAKIS